jgi:hypothetical protein
MTSSSAPIIGDKLDHRDIDELSPAGDVEKRATALAAAHRNSRL